MTKEHQSLQPTAQESKNIPTGRATENEGQQLKNTQNPKGHQFDPSRRTTNK